MAQFHNVITRDRTRGGSGNCLAPLLDLKVSHNQLPDANCWRMTVLKQITNWLTGQHFAHTKAQTNFD